MDCQEFSVLPPDEELVHFIYEQVLREVENKDIFQQVESLNSDEDARRFLIKMNSEESTEKLADLLETGVIWPGYRNEEKGRYVIVHGYSMSKPLMNITLSGIGWFTTEDVIRDVVGKWGEVTQKQVTLANRTVTTDKWMVKLVQRKEIIIPPVVIHAGSVCSSEEKEIWKVYYRGMSRVCYKCFQEGHISRDSQDNPVTLEHLANNIEYEDAPAAPTVDEVISGEKKTFAQIVKDKSFMESRQARQRLAERQKQEKADRVREEREKRDKERQERRKPMQKGFRVNRSGDEFTDEDTSDERKRPRPSPGVSGPESKSSRKFSPGHDQDPDYSSQGGSRGDPPGK